MRKAKGMKERLLSRKLWIAIASFAVFILNDQYTEAMGVIIAYLGIQGGADIVNNSRSVSIPFGNNNAMSQNDDYAVDQSKVVTGKATPLFDEEPKE